MCVLLLQECADRLESEHRELLLQYQSIAEDGVYSTGAQAKRLFAEGATEEAMRYRSCFHKSSFA